MGHLELIASEFIIKKKKCFFIYHIETQLTVGIMTNYFSWGFLKSCINLVIDEIFNFCHLTIKVIKFCCLGNHLPSPDEDFHSYPGHPVGKGNIAQEDL